MNARRRPAMGAVLLAAVLGAGCSAGPPDEVPDISAQLQAQQEALSREALTSLLGRTCAALPEASRLQDLPDDPLGCLGDGPARPASAGDGRPTVVNLWASWCAPCVAEMPLLQDVSERAGEAVRFVGIDVQDEPASAAGLLVATGVRYDQYADPAGDVRAALGAFGLPVTIVYDAAGREQARRFGEVDGAWLADALRRVGVSLAAQGD